MKKWISLFVFFAFLQASAQYSYTYTDPCTLQLKSVFVPAGGGVVVNYFDNHNTFSANDFSSGVFDSWITQVSQQNSNSPCQSVTTTLTNNINTAVVSNTVSILTNVVAISSLAQSMASISSSIGSTMSSTASGVSSMDIGNSVDNNQSNSNEKTNSQEEGNSGSVGNNKTNNQNEGSSSTNTGTGGNNNSTGGTNASSNQSTQGGKQTPQSSVKTNSNGTTNTNGGNSGNTSSTTPNSSVPASNTTTPGSGASTAAPGGTPSVSNQSGSNEASSTGSGGSTANSVSNAIDGGNSEGGSSSGGGGSSSSSSKKQAAAKTSSGSLIASGDMVAISSTDGETANQYKIVASITHANTRGTRIKGVLFNYTTGVNNLNVTLYKSWINKSRSLNTIAANSTMVDPEKNFFNTTTGLESYKVTKNLTGMFGLNFTAGKMGERQFLNLSAVGGGHVSTKVTDKVSTSFLVLAVYSPFTQFYDGKWFGAGVLFVPFSSWDFKITKTFKFNVSFTGVYEMNQSFLNYQVLTGGKITF
jgi:hypothetical protein